MEKMIENFSVIMPLIVAVSTAILTYLITVDKERKAQVNKHKLDILQNVYSPIYREIFFGSFSYEKYNGLNGDQLNKIIKIIETKIELVDPILENLIWDLQVIYRGKPDIVSDNVHFLDHDRRFSYYVIYGYNKLRKELKLPHVPLILIKYKFLKYKNSR